MRFGGHETFWVREGWLFKGLRLLVEHPDHLTDPYAHDYLGVGKNMAKSIRHWLAATGLGERDGTALSATKLGKLVTRYDPYIVDQNTMWVMHANLVGNTPNATTWNWFFNRYRGRRFERATCLEQLKRYVDAQGGKVPRSKTLERDLGTFLSMYARPMPAKEVDPEDASMSPFSELGLLEHYKRSGTYRLLDGPKPIPAEILGYIVSGATSELGDDDGTVDISFNTLAQIENGPGNVLVMDAEGLFELVSTFESDADGIDISSLAGERTLRINKRKPIEWLTDYYKRYYGKTKAA